MNLLEESTKFNPAVHERTEHGDPVREEDGSIKLSKDWKKAAVDRHGRKFNTKIHGKSITLDEEGFITVVKREAQHKPGNTSRIKAFVDKYREDGYAYYVINDDGGRLEQMQAENWEQVVDKKGKSAQLKVGQARDPDTSGILVRKPIEWAEADQELKRQLNNDILEDKKAPNAALGQVSASEDTPLR